MHVRRLALLAPALLLAACGSTLGAQSPASTTATSAAPQPLTAEQVVAKLTATIPGVKLVKTYTAADDPNHQLGRPNGYTSKSAFADSRVPADQVSMLDSDAVERGGSVEVFPDAAGAKARADYIQNIAKSLPLAMEYDFQRGGILIRVSRYLTPDQAKDYQTAATSLG